jgi:hypothetical protein
MAFHSQEKPKYKTGSGGVGFHRFQPSTSNQDSSRDCLIYVFFFYCYYKCALLQRVFHLLKFSASEDPTAPFIAEYAFPCLFYQPLHTLPRIKQQRDA